MARPFLEGRLNSVLIIIALIRLGTLAEDYQFGPSVSMPNKLLMFYDFVTGQLF